MLKIILKHIPKKVKIIHIGKNSEREILEEHEENNTVQNQNGRRKVNAREITSYEELFGELKNNVNTMR
jgi:hypothetical protein